MKRSREYQYYDVSHPEKRHKLIDTRPVFNPYNLRNRHKNQKRKLDESFLSGPFDMYAPKTKKQRERPVIEKMRDKIKQISAIKIPIKKPHVCSVHNDIDVCQIYECPGDRDFPEQELDDETENLSALFENIEICSYIT